MSKILASLNSCSEYIAIKAVIVAELEFSDIERQIFLADLVVAANDPALDDAPEALNRIGVNRADNVLARAVIDDAMLVLVAETAIGRIGIGAKQANAIRDGVTDKSFNRFRLGVLDNTSDDVALALYSTDDWRLVSTAATRLAGLLVPMLVLVVTADVGFVHLNNAAKLGFRLHQSSADFVAHGMCRAVAAEAHDALNLEGTNTLLAGQHRMYDAVPVTQGLIGVLKDGASRMREAIAVLGAHFALPMMAGSKRVALAVATTRAFDAIRPTPRDQIGDAGRFIGKHRFKLGDGHLVDGLGAARHGVSSFVGGYSHG